MRGELKVPPETMICFRALMTRDDCWLGWRGFVGTTFTPTARSPSRMICDDRQHIVFSVLIDKTINYLINLIASQQVQVLVNRASAVDITMSRVRTTSRVTVDPLEPMLSTVTSLQVLKIVGGGDTLRFGGAEEVFFDGVGVVAERDLDGAFKAVDVAVIASTLIGFVLLHERNELLGGPALSLEVIVVGC
jgi:hypothetical protein